MTKQFLITVIQKSYQFLKLVWRKINTFLDKLARRRLRRRLKREELIDLFKILQSEYVHPPLNIDLAVHLQKFDDKKVEDVMVKLSAVKKIGSNEQAGPIIINELHKTGQKYFLVEDSKDAEIIGTIRLNELTSLRTFGKVKSFMNRELFYIDKSAPVFEIINEFFDTSSPIFLVKDGSEIVGVVNVDDFLGDLLLL